MAATATSSSTGVRYAPDDPTLPKPWRGLVDGKTGYLYFWNPETNTTQYERPVASLHASCFPSQKCLSSCVEKSLQGHHNGNDDDDKINDGSDGGLTKVESIAGTYQNARSKSDYSLNDSDAKAGVGRGSYASKGAECSLSAESYRRHHEITVNGVDVPQPFISFQATGFPSEILREERCLFQKGLKEPMSHNVLPSGGALHVFGQPLLMDQFFEGPSKLSSWAGTSVGGDSVCPLAQMEEEAVPPFCLLLQAVQSAGFSAPTPIQAQSWPIALQNRDIVAIAKTGSGKTLGYLIPGFIHLKRRQNNPRLGPTVLVLSPTRELATQIQDEAVKFGRSSKISCTCLYGGAPKGPQLRDLDKGVDIVVATPGRLNDILEMRRVTLHQVSYLVLDEADRMLDMGFEPQIRKIVKEVPSQRQTLMYTATWPKEVRRIAADLLVNPAQVNIGNVDELVANKAITQYVEVLSPMDKRKRLEQILRSQEPGSKIIIFCSTKKMCDLLAGNLTRQFGAAAIHGDKSQGERDHVLSQFRNGSSPVLVATDVAARGLDIKDIRVVINYDFPTGIEDYVHRIGRTGRAGATGVAYTFFCDQDSKHAPELVKLLEGANQRVPPEIRDMASYCGGGGMGRGRRWSSSPNEHDTGYGGGRSSYSGRYGGSGGWGMSSSPDRVGGRNNDHGQQNRHGFESSAVQDSNATGSLPYKSFHESMMAAAKNSKESPSRSRSPTRNSGWVDNHDRARSRSRSSERFDGAAATAAGFSYHESMLAQPRSSVSKNEPTSFHENSPSSPNTDHALGRSSPEQSGSDESKPSYKEQQEETTLSAEASTMNTSMFQTTA